MLSFLSAKILTALTFTSTVLYLDKFQIHVPEVEVQSKVELRVCHRVVHVRYGLERENILFH